MRQARQRAPSRQPAPPSRRGFTLVEALLAVATLALLGLALTSMLVSGRQAIDAQSAAVPLQGALRSQVEQLTATAFEQLASGSSTVNITQDGITRSYPISWVVTLFDVNGDGNPEGLAKRVVVTLAGQSLEVLLVDHQGKVGKL
jgi:type II secretory pathway pseudopilin PulG